MAPLNGIDVGGVDYSPEAIEEIREQLIDIRNHSLDQIQEDPVKGSSYAVFFSHVIAYMSDYLEAVKKQ